MGLPGEGDVKLELECEVLDAGQKFRVTRLPVTASPLLRVPHSVQASLNYGCVLSLV